MSQISWFPQKVSQIPCRSHELKYIQIYHRSPQTNIRPLLFTHHCILMLCYVKVADCITLRKLIRWLTAVTPRVSQSHSDFTLNLITVRYGLATLPHAGPHEARPVTTLIVTRSVTWARLLSDNCGRNATNLHQFFLHPSFRRAPPSPRDKVQQVST